MPDLSFVTTYGATVTPTTRADLMAHPAFASLNTDTDGNPCVWRLEYECEHVGTSAEEPVTWTQDWSCLCDDTCAVCGASVEPVGADWLPVCEKWTESGVPDDSAYRLWRDLPEARPAVAPETPPRPVPQRMITVVVSDSERPWPLIYDLDITDSAPADTNLLSLESDILDTVIEIRLAEVTDDDDGSLDKRRDAMRDRLTLHFALEAPVTIAADWRN